MVRICKARQMTARTLEEIEAIAAVDAFEVVLTKK